MDENIYYILLGEKLIRCIYRHGEIILRHYTNFQNFSAKHDFTENTDNLTVHKYKASYMELDLHIYINKFLSVYKNEIYKLLFKKPMLAEDLNYVNTFSVYNKVQIKEQKYIQSNTLFDISDSISTKYIEKTIKKQKHECCIKTYKDRTLALVNKKSKHDKCKKEYSEFNFLNENKLYCVIYCKDCYLLLDLSFCSNILSISSACTIINKIANTCIPIGEFY